MKALHLLSARLRPYWRMYEHDFYRQAVNALVLDSEFRLEFRPSSGVALILDDVLSVSHIGETPVLNLDGSRADLLPSQPKASSTELRVPDACCCRSRDDAA